MAEALGRNIGEATTRQRFVPWDRRVSRMTGARPKTIRDIASVAGGLGAGQLIGKAIEDPNEEALRSYLVANPFMYEQLNPYAASMMA
jgi:hypothetical protein